MKIFKIIFAIWLGSLCSEVVGQQVSYEVIENEPKFNDIMIMPFLGTYSSLGSTFSLGVGGEIIVRKLPVHLRGYVDVPLIDGSLLTTSDGNYEQSKIIELGAEYPLISISKGKTRKIVLNSQNIDDYSVSVTSIMVDNVAIEKSTLIRAGFMNFSGHFDEFIHFPVNDITYGVGGTHKVSALYAGISRMTRKNVVIESEAYGRNRNTAHFQLYVDAILATGIDLGTWDVLAGQSFDIEEDLNMETTGLGFRAGMYYQFPGYKDYSTNGWGLKSEIGMRPGPTSENLFLLVNVFYAFNIK